VVLFKARLQALENLHGLLDRGLDHIDFLEAPRQGRVFFENATVLGEGGRTNAFELALELRPGFSRLDASKVPPERRTGTDQGVDFVDENRRRVKKQYVT
jgi:hypothetical protein